jgi:hypothetical protein
MQAIVTHFCNETMFFSLGTLYSNAYDDILRSTNWDLDIVLKNHYEKNFVVID